MKTFSLIILLFAICSPIWGAPREAERHVASGIEKHRGGDFKGAEQEFAAASKSQPDDPRILFDQACAAAAQGKHDDAEKLFDKSKLARDTELAAGSLYNLGHLATQRAQSKFGKHPEEAKPDERAEGLKHIERAVAHYRSCLSVDPNHADARHNLELLRLWVKHMQEVWKQRDRDKRRNEMGLLEFLERIQTEQKALREQTRALVNEDDSPRRRQAATLLSQQQRELSEEIAPLQKKLRESLTPAKDPGSAASPPPALSAEQEQGLAALTELTQQAKNAMSRAATDLASNALPQAEESQTQSLEPLNELYRILAPFEHILHKAIQLQEKLIESGAAVQESQNKDAVQEWTEKDLTTEQHQVAGWAEALKPKAEQGLKTEKAKPVVAGPAPPPSNSAGPQAPDPAALRQALIATYEKAIELGPKAEAAAKEAADRFSQRAWAEAKPKQEEALKLLKEIDEQLLKQPNQNQDQQQNQQQNDQSKKQDQQDQQQQDKSDQQQQSQQQKQPESKEKQKQDDSRKQAETVLRQARERERQYRDKQKQQAIIGGVKVDKDW
jgi:hypothetical protein